MADVSIRTTASGSIGHAHRPALRKLWRILLRWRYVLFQRHRYDHLILEHVGDLPILVLPRVFNPKLLRSGEFLASLLSPSLVARGATVLDMGTGSGIGAIFAARWAERVVAIDVNPEAVRCAQINVLLHHLEDRVDVCLGDLFAPVADETFDVVLFNPPFYHGAPKDILDRAWRSTDVVERFAAELPSHLNTGGYALVVLSTDGDTPSFLTTFGACGLRVETLATHDFMNEVLMLLRLRPTDGA